MIKKRLVLQLTLLCKNDGELKSDEAGIVDSTLTERNIEIIKF